MSWALFIGKWRLLSLATNYGPSEYIHRPADSADHAQTQAICSLFPPHAQHLAGKLYYSFNMHVLAALRISICVAILNIAKSVLSSVRFSQYTAISSTAATQHGNTTLALPPPISSVTNPAGYVECYGSRFGIDLSKQSCVDALGSLPVDITLRTFGQRDKGPFDILLPRRYLSSDGLCAIDISNAKRHPFGDSATSAEIQAGAHRLVNQCVLRGSRKMGYRPVGGSIRDLGK